MFVIELIYKVDLAQIEAHMPAHVRFPKKYYAAGDFLAWGARVPRDGGIILAVAERRSRIEAIMAEDPFQTHGSPMFGSSSFGSASVRTTSSLRSGSHQPATRRHTRGE